MKIFCRTRETKKDLRKYMSIVAEEHNVKNISFNNQTSRLAGLYNSKTKGIFINNKQTKKLMMFAFFHELAHHVAVQRKHWIGYHKGQNNTIAPSKQFEIENKIDKIAKTLWNKYVNKKIWGNYKFIYPKSNKIVLTTWLAEYSNTNE